ncbi:MAG: hypothetical protein IPI60_08480 [Saprospiraceae bacterium]|nr:hypothetical protein [Saprospiraceae bacterium]
MKPFSTKLFFIFTIYLISNSIHGQSGEIKIQFIGNCGLYMSDGKEDIYIDFPYKSGAYGYMTYEITGIG